MTDDATKNQQAQACSLMMEANGTISHFPPTTWQCYSQAGAAAAAASNIAGINTLFAISGYTVDYGNPATIGHRRWILSNWLGPTIGIGSSTNYSCLEVVGTMAGVGAAKAWTAWPPPGTVPLQAMTWPPPGTLPFQATTVDNTGWTIQSDSIDLSKAVVNVSENGVNRPVTVTQLAAGIGSNYAVAFTPVGWTSTAGHSYTVSVTGTSQSITYTVNFIGCP